MREVSTPGPAEVVERARRLVDRYDAAVLTDDGLMIDEAVVRGVRRVLAAGEAVRP
ncbi:hypothetical protein [Streptomyces sp. TRM75563]|uniref:hypothetical protein n=1 Tax=Streptomyces sp. TRM75563 TaxID=2817418 RepID=UPI001F6250DE|nr:hypothetical protein [Streptomyces sp. TRM75563]MCI4046134.1 hypothetical protein [Streptomyces sp. TRM75563]